MSESWPVIFNQTSLANQFPLIAWVFWLEILTIIAFPICFIVFSKFEDRGIMLSKMLGLLILSYLAWLGGHMSLFPFTQFNLRVLFIALLTCSTLILWSKRNELILFVKSNMKLIFFEYALFYVSFGAFTLIRFMNPDLWHPIMGGEKPMDFAFLNAIIRTTSFPPQDPWFAGQPIHYYYFGQLLIATLTKISGVIPSVAYNLALAFLFAQTIATTFSIIFHLTKSKLASILGAFFLAVSGNLGQISVIVKRLFQTYPLPINSWYWTATRIMPHNEINEFPFFTFLYADLHAHLISLPIALLIIAVALTVFDAKNLKQKLGVAVMLGMLLGFIRASNTWDYPSYVLVVSAFFLISSPLYQKNIIKAILVSVGMIVLTAIVSLIAIAPFLAYYQTGALGIGMYRGPATHLPDYAIVHGFFLFIITSFLFIHIQKNSFKKLKNFPVLLALFSVFAALITTHLWLFATGMVLLILAILIIKTPTKFTHSVQIPILLAIIGVGFTFIPDLVDFRLGLGRMNTVFKFYFQGWIFFSLATGAMLPFIWKKLKHISSVVYFLWLTFFSIFFVATLTYTVTSTWAKTQDRMDPKASHTLDGMRYMNTSIYYDQNTQLSLHWDYLAINWLLSHISGSPVILEGNAPIYRWGSRVSVYTGLPTVVGWDWHEIAHRFDGTIVQTRVADVKQAYETTSIEELYRILSKYRIQYIYLGELERAYYPKEAGLAKFNALVGTMLSIAYHNQEVTIYQVNQ